MRKSEPRNKMLLMLLTVSSEEFVHTPFYLTPATLRQSIRMRVFNEVMQRAAVSTRPVPCRIVSEPTGLSYASARTIANMMPVRAVERLNFHGMIRWIDGLEQLS